MKKNYVLLAHQNPKQLELLIQQLDDGLSVFVIHLDLKTDQGPFLYLKSSCVHFISDRVTVRWGDFSVVQATLNCLQYVQNHTNGGFVILLSGQCFPLRSAATINTFLTNYSNFNFIELFPITSYWNAEECKKRVQFYCFTYADTKGSFVRLNSFKQASLFELKLIVKFYGKQLLVHHNFRILGTIRHLFKLRTSSIPHFGGSQWFALNDATFRKMMQWIAIHPEFLKFHKHTHCADELFFHSILKELSEKDRSVQFKDSLTYVSWNKKGVPLPVTFEEADWDEIMTVPQNKLFVRKVNITTSLKMLSLLQSLTTSKNN